MLPSFAIYVDVHAAAHHLVCMSLLPVCTHYVLCPYCPLQCGPVSIAWFDDIHMIYDVLSCKNLLKVAVMT